MDKDFLLEHYRQVNEHLREVDRKRDVLLGSYFLLILGTLSFIRDIVDTTLKSTILVGLIILGVIVAIAITRLRGWHAEYVNIAMAIHKSFLNGSDLYSSASALKRERINFCPYFSPRGVEFMMFLLTLGLVSLPETLLCVSINEYFKAGTLPLMIFLICMIGTTWGVGLWGYRRSLLRREENYPTSSWCIVRAALRCKLCGQTFHTEKDFRVHLRKTSLTSCPGLKGTKVCDICGKEFKSEAGLRRHLRMLWAKDMIHRTRLLKVDP